ncbi:MAG: hypothetical protein AB7Y46_03345 [Armatimonadota bacterium]
MLEAEYLPVIDYLSPARHGTMRDEAPIRRLRTPGALALLAVLAALPAPAQDGWQRLLCLDPAFSVEAPAGWQILPEPGRGARLIAPGAGPVVEVVAWEALHRPATAEKAAVEHEGVLGRAVAYERLEASELRTDAGASALMVVGRAEAEGITDLTIFCAYAAGNTHWVLGSFMREDDLARLRAELLDRMMRSFRPGDRPPAGPATHVEPPATEPSVPAHAPPAPEPPSAAPPEPVGAEPTLGPAPPTAEPGPSVTAAGVAGAEAVPPVSAEPGTPWITHANPAGFSLAIPADWEVRVTQGVIAAGPAEAGAARRAVLLWPVSGTDPGGAEALRRLAAQVDGLELVGPPAVEDQQEGLVRLTASTDRGERITATWAHVGSDGLLVAVIAPGGMRDRDFPTMARVAAGFRPGTWAARGSAEQVIAGDRRALTWRLPVGWTSRGGVRDDDGELSIDIEALSPGGEMGVGWQQPLRPSFRALTPLLESLGWREGERYSMPEGGAGLLIYRRRTPEKLVEDLLLARDSPALTNVRVQTLLSDEAVAGLLGGDEAAGEVVHVRGQAATGPRERLYLAASARARPPLAATCWEGAALRADAPEGSLAEAVAVLERMVRSAEPTTMGASMHGNALRDLIERARSAVGAVPPELRRAASTEGLTGVLEGAGGGAQRTWVLPPQALAYWALQGSTSALPGQGRSDTATGG